MIYIENGEKRYKCTAPDEQRVNIYPQGRQWVLDFTICDSISADEVDALLSTEDKVFVYVDDTTAEEKTFVFSGYSKINGASIKYNQDMSCTVNIQLGKEIECNARKI